MGVILNRDAILAKREIPKQQIAVPEWEGDVFIRALTAGERDGLEAYVTECRREEEVPKVRAKVAVMSLVDADGKQLFGDADIEALSSMYSKPLDRIYDVATRLNKLTPEDVEALEKN